MAFVRIADARFPQQPAGARVERHHSRVARSEQNLVLRDREASQPAVARPLLGSGSLFPDQFAGLRIERLDDVVRVEEKEGAVVHDRMRLVRAAFSHRPHPRELEIRGVLRGDLFQRAVAPPMIVAAEHQPVAGIRLPQHLVGHRDEVLHGARHRDPFPRRSHGCRVS